MIVYQKYVKSQSHSRFIYPRHRHNNKNITHMTQRNFLLNQQQQSRAQPPLLHFTNKIPCTIESITAYNYTQHHRIPHTRGTQRHRPAGVEKCGSASGRERITSGSETERKAAAPAREFQGRGMSRNGLHSRRPVAAGNPVTGACAVYCWYRSDWCLRITTWCRMCVCIW